MPFDPDKPYNDLPLLRPPKAELETKAVLRKAIAANKALAELNGAAELIPNQGVLINAIVLQEAKASLETRALPLERRPMPAQPYVRETNICPKKPVFWTYSQNISNGWTCSLVAVIGDVVAR